jgi:hypothetical protein
MPARRFRETRAPSQEVQCRFGNPPLVGFDSGLLATAKVIGISTTGGRTSGCFEGETLGMRARPASAVRLQPEFNPKGNALLKRNGYTFETSR